MSGASLHLDRVRVDYGRSTALDEFTLKLAPGEIACLLGPSGCGKTTVLRAIAGFEPVRAGEVRVGDRVVSSSRYHLPPERREVGLMFQESALFPHLDAAANIGFGLRRLPRGEREARVASLLARVGLDGFGARHPHELSGGQQQRVALARALAPAPRVLLLDEPFSSLDADTRHHLVHEVRTVLKQAGQTALLVTHDADEAEAMADWIGTLRAGRLVDWRRSTGAPSR